ncbi:probable tRNA pseudouridine synthase 1 isoform X1 [Asterias rubens]|uniref:probable tRNA pseudouridine synthase 1 isoform X1 n=2 Tax=Asterias rubens TaxID=7604 RepID=UPI0014557746|nr:probable tRNA pseudouridine synthase 1 isoform X1 [Asterias rubens]
MNQPISSFVNCGRWTFKAWPVDGCRVQNEEIRVGARPSLKMRGVPCKQRFVSDLNGLFAVYKPTGITSAFLVNRLKQILFSEQKRQDQDHSHHKTKGISQPSKQLRIGHGGTLDMNASGVLVVGVGRGTKMLTNMLKGRKRYHAVGCLGSATDTQDALGKVTLQLPLGHVTQDMVEASLEGFVGNIMQVPPLYSALKMGGVRMSDLARSGEINQPKPARPVTVHNLKCLQFSPPYFTLDVYCGGGFYVRQLIHDLGKVLGTCAHLVELERTQQGPFTLQHVLQTEEEWTFQNICKAIADFDETIQPGRLLE